MDTQFTLNNTEFTINITPLMPIPIITAKSKGSCDGDRSRTIAGLSCMIIAASIVPNFFLPKESLIVKSIVLLAPATVMPLLFGEIKHETAEIFVGMSEIFVTMKEYCAKKLESAAEVIDPCTAAEVIDPCTAEALDLSAVSEYILSERSSLSANCTKHILKNINAARILVENKGDFDKRNQDGWNFLDYLGGTLSDAGDEIFDFEVFKLFIDNEIKITSVGIHWAPYFHYCLELKDSRYLEYLLQKSIVKPVDFLRGAQIEGTAKAGELLKQYGFDIPRFSVIR